MSLGLLLVGAALLAVGYGSWAYRSGWLPATATVISSRDLGVSGTRGYEHRFEVDVRYVTDAGQSVETTYISTDPAYTDGPEPGTLVEIRYDPDNPRDIRAATPRKTGMASGLMVVGTLLALAGFVSLVAGTFERFRRTPPDLTASRSVPQGPPPGLRLPPPPSRPDLSTLPPPSKR